jgi:hypothetical protein
MTRAEAESLLTEWAAVNRSRDDRIRAALAAGLTKHRIAVLTGIARSTIARVLDGG